MSTSATGEEAQARSQRQPLSEKQRQILEYLRTRADSKTYFKSRLIGDDLGLSAKEVGANMQAVRRAATSLSIEKWGYSSGTTWKVTR